MSQTFTINLPDTTVKYLEMIAASSQQSLEQIVRQSIEGNLPPKIPSESPKLKAELLQMQQLSVRSLRTIANAEISSSQQQRHLELLDKNSEGNISELERQELQKLRTEADELMLRKAYAWALLRWRGFPLPSPH
ncbi:MAG: hypothetical protein U0175_12845 [Caldilineaceae bacterium]